MSFRLQLIKKLLEIYGPQVYGWPLTLSGSDRRSIIRTYKCEKEQMGDLLSARKYAKKTPRTIQGPLCLPNLQLIMAMTFNFTIVIVNNVLKALIASN